MSAAKVIIATRQSKLALWQANFIQARLRAAHPGLVVELLGITTKGDKWLSSPLSELGGKGLFIKELEQALLDRAADIAVHSVKDVPAELPEPFAMPVLAFREDVRDALISRSGVGLAELPVGARVGSSSLRRQSQLLSIRGDLDVLPIRGNVDTRLRKLDDGEFDAIVLAAAGLNRLGLAGRVNEYLEPEVCLPAAGQGALGIECRSGDARILELLEPLQDDEVHACVTAERKVSEGLGADCTAPLAAFATVAGGGLTLRALLARPDGSLLLRAQAVGREPQRLGAEVTASLLDQGAAQLLGAG
ncbi:MAG: hydroxymethylbilane synthase [Gammaproteobacteria bacterium]|nr:hydroxymethylbilane synthase [Gammaproteobacteria bacterium]